MNLSRKVRALVWEQALSVAAEERDRGMRKLSAELCVARARVAQLEAENSGQRQAMIALNRHEGLASDFAAIREAEREACARTVENLGFGLGAKAIRERP